MIVRNPQLLWLLLLLPAFVLLWRWRGVRVPLAALALRLLAVATLVLALADPLIGAAPPPSGPLVVLVDQSDSLAEPTRATLRAQAAAIARDAGGAQVLYLGADVVSGPQTADGADRAPLAPDPGGSDLAAGLRAARALLPGGGRVVLLSDGLATGDDALLEAQLAAEAGVTVDVVPVAPRTAPEVAITGLNAPASLRVGEEFPITIAVRSTPAPGDATPLVGRLRLWEGEQLLGDEQVTMEPGDELFTFRHTAAAPGVVRLRAELEVAAGDTFGANNRGAATAVVNPPPQVLLVAAGDDEAALLGDALQRQGVTTRRITPAELPTRLSELASYDGMVLIDVPATALSLDQMAGVREFVRSEGRGLVAVGGRNSFTLGAYKDTPLEDVLPVTMEPPPRPQRTEIALLLIVDRSASMTAAFGVSKFDMAKEAAILASDSLKPEDRIGILAFDTGQLWVVPFQPVGEGASLAAIQQAIMELPSGGGTDIELALATGLPALAEQPTGVRHAVLLTDGRSFSNNLATYQRMVETARAQEITLSTIAIGEDSDTLLLDQLARWGGGRYYYADQPEDIPRLTLLESEIARATPSVEGELQPSLSLPHPIVRDFAPAELPELSGYVATTARDAAEVVLRAPEDDPLLATWQYGLGRAAAWTPTAGAPWATAWTRWAGFERFWAQLVRYTLPEPDSGPLQVRVEPRPGGARLVVDALQPGGAPLDLATVNARITLPTGEQRSFDVRQTAPGRYAQELVLPTPGAYVVSVVLLRDGGLQQRDVGYVQPIPAEYRQPGDPAQGQALLTTIAATTGGTLRSAPPQPGVPTPGADPASEGLWPWLIGLALGLWVLEIAVRRGVFVRQG
ncbi:MAG: VWA domain-containing protein [Chloroflexi bacterium]|nr:VWA domain-containing protein [Chloroflexota bacterium]